MSYITPSQFRSGLEETKEYVDSRVVSAGGGNANIQHSYIVGEKAFRNDWLSDTNGGDAITPVADNTVYFIRTEGEFFGETYYWDADKNVYRLVGKKNVANTPYKEIKTFGIKEYPITPGVYNGRGNWMEIPVVSGDEIHMEYDIMCCDVSVVIGFSGDNTVTHSFSVGSTREEKTGTLDFVVTEELAAKGPFVIYRYTSGWAWEYFEILSGTTLTINKVFQDFETPDYVPPTSTADGQSGLVPSISKDNTSAEALTPQGWDAIDFDITKDDIRTAFEESYGSVTPKGQIYSLDEQVIGQWIDGKPLYRKVVDCGSGPKNTEKVISIGFHASQYVRIEGILQSDSYVIPLNNSFDSSNSVQYQVGLQLALSSSGDSIHIVSRNVDRSSGSVYVILEYTKTTD